MPTVFAARQFVSHGHVRVNGRRVNIPSYRCREGDVIEVRDKAKDAGMVLESSQSAERDVPDYIEVDHTKMTAKLTRVPTLSDVPYPVMMEPNLVIEFYSRSHGPPGRGGGRARGHHYSPVTLATTAPNGASFSTATSSVSPAIQTRFITPPTNRSSMSTAQQPRQ